MLHWKELAAKAMLRAYHETETSLGGAFWGVSDRTLRAWMSDKNKTPVPLRVVEFIENEAEHDRSRLAGPRGG